MRLTGWARGVRSTLAFRSLGDRRHFVERHPPWSEPRTKPQRLQLLRPGYTPPNSAISAQGLVAPEFQITNEPSVIAYVNYMQALIVNGAGDSGPITPTSSPMLRIVRRW
jgi:hypothetical protein